MIFRQYRLGCLSLHSYLIGDETTGRTVVVDPQRDIDEYLADAVIDGLRIGRVIETHFHADFVSGQLELDPRTPTIVYCAGGYRSSIAASLVRSHGFSVVADVLGGYGAWATLPACTPELS
ncbi:MAG: MBL fold metallo-hydrolase [Acidobacteria bacterium]|nr:MBL fold metallo-hydrolase [Acidobacteriota bacterium]